MAFYIDLQLFAGDEKTEKATPKKKQDARKKGQVLQSREINSALILLFSMLFIKNFGWAIINPIYELLVLVLGKYFSIEGYDVFEGYRLLIVTLVFTLKAAFLIVGINFILAFIASYLQVGNLFTTDTLQPKLERLNPLEGFKRMFSLRAVVEFVKSLIKLFIVAMMSYGYIKDNLNLFLKTGEIGKLQFSKAIFDFSMELGIRMAATLLVLGFLDYLYQAYEYDKNLKMSKQEIKDEYKQSEGDPQIKGKIKERQRQAAMRRMMQDVPKADVIITNPTHFAIAIKYDDSKFDAPYVLAKGKNLIALKIREKAGEFDIPIVENKPLARALYDVVEIGFEIPLDLYEAVAEVLAYVYSLKGEI